MRRRGNKSSKVPNVKLRPPQPHALPRRTQTDRSTCWAQDSQTGSDDTSVFDLCPRPFKGVVICATGVVDKPTLFKQALELGATSVSAFTDRVTHLVAVDHGGPKYMCALERKIPILKSSWITECYQIWLRGDDVDLEESVASHRLPIFSGVVLCPSGIVEITRRTQINRLLTQQEGVYLKNLERPVRVTHLLCSGDEETDKMRYAEKFNSTGEATVHLVWEEWFWDSLEFGGRFDEAKYQVRRPRPERKSLPEKASSPPPSSTTQSDEGDDTSRSSPHYHHSHTSKQIAPPQIQAQNQDDADEELASVTRLPAVTLQLWGSLLKPRGYEISQGELLRSPSKVYAAAQPVPQQSTTPIKDMEGSNNGSVIAQCRRANSFVPARLDMVHPSRPLPFKRAPSVLGVGNPIEEGGNGSFMAPAPSMPQEKNGESSTTKCSNIFVGLKFLALGEAKTASVKSAVELNGGRWYAGDEDEDDVDYVVVRLVSGSKLYREEQDEALRGKYRTECWLERCIFEERLCPLEDHVTFLPLSINTPVPGAENITLSFSGLDQSEACWITRLLRALGMNLAPGFSRRSTHLLCPSGVGSKFAKAREWGTPVVSLKWLEEVARCGMIPAVDASDEMDVGKAGVRELDLDMDLYAVGMDGKGKGRATDKGKAREDERIDERMADSIEVETASSTGQRTPLTQGEESVDQQHMSLQPDLSFGEMNGILDRPQSTQPPPQRLLSSKNVDRMARTGPPPPPPLVTRQNSSIETDTPSSLEPAPRRPTPLEIERERKQARIPSSKSPSPLKIPNAHATPTKKAPLQRQGTRTLSVSPTKLTREASKALRDNITSLLGKRQPSAGEHDEAMNLRAGKRPRPQRSKQLSRQPSKVQLPEVVAASVPAPVFGDAFETYDDDINILEQSSVGDESMRVTYVDPGQRDEKMRLMSLLRSDKVMEGGEGGKASSLRTRRSARIAGF